jgi:Tol biopolymer transport system component
MRTRLVPPRWLSAPLALLAGLASCHRGAAGVYVVPSPGERHLANIRQLTFGGENAEAYFSADGQWLTFQSTREGRTCDQQYVMRIDGSQVRRVSNGLGKTTCGYFYDADQRLFYASTHDASPDCPPRPDYSQGYVWRLDDYDIYSENLDGSDVRRLTNSPGYDAEGTLSPDGRTIVFTSLRYGDLDIYTMNTDGSGVRRLTTELGYDGGPFFSHDGSKIVYRAFHPETPEDQAVYRTLLAQHLVRPTRMDLWIMNVDGSDRHQITNLGGASFAPYFTPDDRRVIFASNYKDPRGRNFDLYLINLAGTGLEQVPTPPDLHPFAMFFPHGRKLVWASNRHGSVQGETDIFIADWRP